MTLRHIAVGGLLLLTLGTSHAQASASTLYPPVAGATYTGRVEDGTLSITVSADGTQVTSYSFQGASGTNGQGGCTVGGAGSEPAWGGAAITSGSFDYSSPPSFDLQGSFNGAQSVTGTLDVDVGGSPSGGGCSTGLVPWTATTAAVSPTTGAACQSSDGKLNGRGSTLQSWLQEDLIGTYAANVCGEVAAAPVDTSGSGVEGHVEDQTHLYFQDTKAGSAPASAFGAGVDPTDPFTTAGKTVTDPAPLVSSSGSNEPYYGSDQMITYNPYEAANYGATGTVQGGEAISCRTDAFAGVDLPYTEADWQAINGTAGDETAEANGSCAPPQPAAAPNVDLHIVTAGSIWTPPFEVSPVGGFPNQSDPTGAANPVSFGGSAQGGALLSFPVGISAVAFPINLQTGLNSKGAPLYCGSYGSATAGTTTKPVVRLTVADLAALLGGVITNWEQLDSSYTFGGTVYHDAGENPSLATCNLTVVRIVRADGSGTTQAVLNFLNDATGSNSTGLSTLTTCSPSGPSAPENGTFGALDSAVVTTNDPDNSAGTNDLWPGELISSATDSDVTDPVWTAAGGGCSEVIPGGATSVGAIGAQGGPALLQTLENYAQTDTVGSSQTAGGIGYADVADLEHDANSGNLVLPTIEPSSSPSLGSGLGYVGTGANQTSYLGPKTGTGSNCQAAVSLPGGAGDMGLNGEWGLDYGTAGTYNPSNYDDITWGHESAYPVCALAWDLVWGNQFTNPNGVSDPEPELDADQVRTLYSYFTYVFSDAAQSGLAAAGYTQLPESAIDTLRQEFQAAF